MLSEGTLHEQVQIDFQKQQLLKRQEADNEPKQKQLEMQRALNIQNAEVQKEALRSTQLTKVPTIADATVLAIFRRCHVMADTKVVSLFVERVWMPCNYIGVCSLSEEVNTCRQWWTLKPPQPLLMVRPRP